MDIPDMALKAMPTMKVSHVALYPKCFATMCAMGKTRKEGKYRRRATLYTFSGPPNLFSVQGNRTACVMMARTPFVANKWPMSERSNPTPPYLTCSKQKSGRREVKQIFWRLRNVCVMIIEST